MIKFVFVARASNSQDESSENFNLEQNDGRVKRRDITKKALNKGKERSGSKLAVNGNSEEKKARGRVNKSNAVIKSALQRNQTFSSFSPVFECPASLNVIFV